MHCNDITLGICISPGTVVSCRYQADNMKRYSEFCSCIEDTGHGGSPGHITLHHCHVITRLYIESPRIIDYSLAYKDQWFFINTFFRPPFENTESGRINTTPVDCKKPSHFKRFNLAFIQYINAESCQFPCLLDLRCQFCRIKIINRFIYQIPGNIDSIGKRLKPSDRCSVRIAV